MNLNQICYGTHYADKVCLSGKHKYSQPLGDEIFKLFSDNSILVRQIRLETGSRLAEVLLELSQDMTQRLMISVEAGCQVPKTVHGLAHALMDTCEALYVIGM